MPRKSIADISLCKGCRTCIDQCPKGAIEPLTKVNKKGYEIISIDEEKCTGCSFCYIACPDYVFTIVEK